MIRVEKKIDFINARRKASEILLLQDDKYLSFPIDIKKIVIPRKEIKIASYREYSSIVGENVNNIRLDGKFDDAMVIPIKGIYLILYNDEIQNSGRILWNLAHELGHIVLEHKDQGPIEEAEAHTFASQLLLPQCLLKALFKGGKKITIPYLMKKFGLSEKASISCLKSVKNKLENNYDAMYDDIILEKCDKFLKLELKTVNSLNKNYDEMDDKRNQWLYE